MRKRAVRQNDSALHEHGEGECPGALKDDEALARLYTGLPAPCPHPASLGAGGPPSVSLGEHPQSPAAGRTVVSCQEGGLVDVVFDADGLAVQDGRRGDLPVGGVQVQPAGWVRQL